MAEEEAAALSREEVAAWVGGKIDEIGGDEVGGVRGFFVDDQSGDPVWLIVALAGRRLSLRPRPARLVAIPLSGCAGGGGRAWTAHEREAIGTAPTVDSTRPLLREHELTICAHFGIGEKVGRAAEVARRDAGAVTARPA